MKVDLKNAVFVITGTLNLMTRFQAEVAIKEVGGTTASSVTKKTSYVIAGKNPSSKYTKAKNMGIPILTEEDFKALISGKTVEVEEVGAAGERSVDELLGEVRSVMQGAPTAQMWSALVKLVDACRAEDVHVLTGYIDGYITRWTEESMKGLVGSSFDAKSDKDDTRSRWWYYYHRGVSGELRVAPEHWVGEMQQGVDSPKYRLVRALDLTSTKMTSTAIVKVMAHPALIHLERLALPERSASSKGLVKAICESETLVYLNLGKIDDKLGAAFKAYGQSPGSLLELDLSKIDVLYSMRDEAKVCEFLHAPYFHTVQTLHLGRFEDLKFIKQADQHDLLPAVRSLVLTSGYYITPLINAIFSLGWGKAHLTQLTFKQVFNHPTHIADWEALLDRHGALGQLNTVDLSLLSLWRQDEEETLDDLLLRTLPSSRLLGCVETLILGQHATPVLVELLRDKFPDLEIV